VPTQHRRFYRKLPGIAGFEKSKMTKFAIKMFHFFVAAELVDTFFSPSNKFVSP